MRKTIFKYAEVAKLVSRPFDNKFEVINDKGETVFHTTELVCLPSSFEINALAKQDISLNGMAK